MSYNISIKVINITFSLCIFTLISCCCLVECECENGGKCIGGTSNCRCPAIFTGKRCQTSGTR